VDFKATALLNTIKINHGVRLNMTLHQYAVEIKWQGNIGTGTSSYQAYRRDFEVRHETKPSIAGSADPAYLGDPTRWNPEELLIAALSSCHKLWYLHLCADHNICVLDYTDQAMGEMQDQDLLKRGHMTQVTLRPRVIIQDSEQLALAESLHQLAHHECMIANSVNFPVHCQAHCEALTK